MLNKKISDMMDYIQDDTVKLQTADMVSAERIKKDVREKIKKSSRTKRHRSAFVRMVGSAAALMLMAGVVVTVKAYPGLMKYENPIAMVKAFFGSNGIESSDGVVEYDEDGRLVTNIPAWDRVPVDETLAEELIEPYISAENGSVNYAGYTLTAKANLYDAGTGSGLMYFTLENPKGISGYVVSPNGQVWWNPETINVFARTNYAGMIYRDNEMSTDTKLYLCEYYIVADRENTDESFLELGDYTDGDIKERIEIQSAMDNEMAGIELGNGAIKMSPIGIKLDKTALGLKPSDDIGAIVFQYVDGREYVLFDKDGFVSNDAYALNYDNNCTYMYNRIVGIDSLLSVTVDGVTYDIK